MTEAATLRVRIQTGCVVDGQNYDAGDELEVTPVAAKKLVGWKLGLLVDGDVTEAVPMGKDEPVAARRKRTRG